MLLDNRQRGMGVQRQEGGHGVGEAESGANQERKTGEPLVQMHIICSMMLLKRLLIELPHDLIM